MAVLVAILAPACNDDEPYVEPLLEVTSHNIRGEWQLSEWRGEPLAEGSYVYISFERKDNRYILYQNIDSHNLRIAEGTFNITVDESMGSIIRGLYDNSMSTEWSHRYIVTDLTSKRMVWTATDNGDDISVYTRCEIQAELKGSGE